MFLCRLLLFIFLLFCIPNFIMWFGIKEKKKWLLLYVSMLLWVALFSVYSLFNSFSFSFSSALCGLVSTVWFPIGAHQEHGLMSFGFSLYTGWVGTILSLLGGSILTCCSSESSSSSHSYQDNNRFYYSKQGGGNQPAASSVNHAKSAHVWNVRDSEYHVDVQRTVFGLYIETYT